MTSHNLLADSDLAPGQDHNGRFTPEVPGSAATLHWRRVHPLTPILRTWAFAAAFLWVIVSQLTELENVQAVGTAIRDQALYTGAVVVGVLGLSAASAALGWRYTAYAIDTAPGGSGAVHFREGIVFRRQRQARLARIQAVDVKRSLLARVLGLAELKCEVAGGSASSVTIGYLREADALVLRQEILELAGRYAANEAQPSGAIARAVGLDNSATPAGIMTPADSAQAQELASSPVLAQSSAAVNEFAPSDNPGLPLYNVTAPRLIGATVLSGGLLTIAVFIVAAFIALLVSGFSAAGWQGIASVSIAAAPILLGAVLQVGRRFAQEFDFRASLSPAGIHLSRGLTETRQQTIPPARIQAIKVSQSMLWRPLDWWRVTVTVAGYGPDSQNDSRSVLLPVGTREEAIAALWAILPDLGVADPMPLVTAGLAGKTGGFDPATFAVAPQRARLLDPIGWRRRGIALTDQVVLIRSGRLTRTLTITPRSRIQSLAAHQGPVQRPLGLATLAAHVPPGPVAPLAKNLDARVVSDVLAELAQPANAVLIAPKGG